MCIWQFPPGRSLLKTEVNLPSPWLFFFTQVDLILNLGMAADLAIRHLAPTIISHILLNPFKPCDLYMCQYTVSSSAHAMGCRMFGTKPIAWHSENRHRLVNKHIAMSLFSLATNHLYYHSLSVSYSLIPLEFYLNCLLSVYLIIYNTYLGCCLAHSVLVTYVFVWKMLRHCFK